eukprot:8252844-Lingulodinium_polyedra.AAC.1
MTDCSARCSAYSAAENNTPPVAVQSCKSCRRARHVYKHSQGRKCTIANAHHNKGNQGSQGDP